MELGREGRSLGRSFISWSEEEGEGVQRTKEGSQAWGEVQSVEPPVLPTLG